MSALDKVRADLLSVKSGKTKDFNKWLKKERLNIHDDEPGSATVRRRIQHTEHNDDGDSALQRMAVALNPRAFAPPPPPPKKRGVPEPPTPLKVINDEDELMRAYQIAEAAVQRADEQHHNVRKRDPNQLYDIRTKIRTPEASAKVRDRQRRNKPPPPRLEALGESVNTMLALHWDPETIMEPAARPHDPQDPHPHPHPSNGRLAFEARVKQDLSTALEESVTRIQIRAVRRGAVPESIYVYLTFVPPAESSGTLGGAKKLAGESDPVSASDLLWRLQRQVSYNKVKLFTGQVILVVLPHAPPPGAPTRATCIEVTQHVDPAHMPEPITEADVEDAAIYEFESEDHERAIVDATRAREAALRAELTKSEQCLAATMQQLQEVQAQKVELEEGLSRNGSPERCASLVASPGFATPRTPPAAAIGPVLAAEAGDMGDLSPAQAEAIVEYHARFTVSPETVGKNALLTQKLEQTQLQAAGDRQRFEERLAALETRYEQDSRRHLATEERLRLEALHARRDKAELESIVDSLVASLQGLGKPDGAPPSPGSAAGDVFVPTPASEVDEERAAVLAKARVAQDAIAAATAHKRNSDGLLAAYREREHVSGEMEDERFMAWTANKAKVDAVEARRRARLEEEAARAEADRAERQRKREAMAQRKLESREHAVIDKQKSDAKRFERAADDLMMVQNMVRQREAENAAPSWVPEGQPTGEEVSLMRRMQEIREDQISAVQREEAAAAEKRQSDEEKEAAQRKKKADDDAMQQDWEDAKAKVRQDEEQRKAADAIAHEESIAMGARLAERDNAAKKALEDERVEENRIREEKEREFKERKYKENADAYRAAYNAYTNIHGNEYGNRQAFERNFQKVKEKNEKIYRKDVLEQRLKDLNAELATKKLQGEAKRLRDFDEKMSAKIEAEELARQRRLKENEERAQAMAEEGAFWTLAREVVALLSPGVVSDAIVTCKAEDQAAMEQRRREEAAALKAQQDAAEAHWHTIQAQKEAALKKTSDEKAAIAKQAADAKAVEDARRAVALKRAEEIEAKIAQRVVEEQRKLAQEQQAKRDEAVKSRDEEKAKKAAADAKAAEERAAEEKAAQEAKAAADAKAAQEAKAAADAKAAQEAKAAADAKAAQEAKAAADAKAAQEAKAAADAKAAQEAKAAADAKAAQEAKAAADAKAAQEAKAAADAKAAQEAKAAADAKAAQEAKAAADAKAAQEAKAAADAKAAQEAKAAADAKAAQEAKKAAEEKKAKQEQEAKAAAEKKLLEAKVAADAKKAADMKAVADVKAAADAEAKATAEVEKKAQEKEAEAADLKKKLEADAAIRPISYTWDKPGKLGMVLHSKTSAPVGATLKAFNIPETEEALGKIGVKVGMMLCKVAAHDTIGMPYAAVMMKIKEATRPLTIVFNEVKAVEARHVLQEEAGAAGSTDAMEAKRRVPGETNAAAEGQLTTAATAKQKAREALDKQVMEEEAAERRRREKLDLKAKEEEEAKKKKAAIERKLTDNEAKKAAEKTKLAEDQKLKEGETAVAKKTAANETADKKKAIAHNKAQEEEAEAADLKKKLEADAAIRPISYTWDKPGKLGMVLHSKTSAPVGATLKAFNIPETEEALGKIGVKVGMMLCKVAAHDTIGMPYAAVMMKIKEATRPLTIVFNEVKAVEARHVLQEEAGAAGSTDAMEAKKALEAVSSGALSKKVPQLKHIQMLLDTPSFASKFDETFGSGAAAAILKDPDAAKAKAAAEVSGESGTKAVAKKKTPSEKHIQMLLGKPSFASKFDETYGEGAAAAVFRDRKPP